jgi:hypothetical protein
MANSRTSLIFGALLLCSTVWAPSARASLITENMVFSDLGNPVATGSLSYDASKVGILNYGDLASFDIHIVHDYDLTFLTTIATQVVQFAYNTRSQSFEPGGLFGSELLGGASPARVSSRRASSSAREPWPGRARSATKDLPRSASSTPIPLCLPALFAMSLVVAGLIARRSRRNGELRSHWSFTP